MSPITRAEAFRLIRKTRASLHHVDPYVDDAVRDAQEIYFVRFQDAERFLALIWPEVEGGRILTPPDEPRTLKDVANRMIYSDWTFEDLNQDLGLPLDEHDPELFVKSLYLDENFDYDKFGMLIIAPSTQEEREQSTDGSFYIYDGFHRGLVLAKRLLREEVDYQQVTAFLVIPRPL
ncbi:MAG: hypothetical protein ACETWG_13705 [Candidatus Neomarinimicrobiota bacterium]